jgi:hypothetical protein
MLCVVGVLAMHAAAPPESAGASARAAGCGGVEHFWPSNQRTEVPPPLAVGDSIMLGAVEPLRRRGFEVDVRGCRQFSEGLSVLRSRARTSSLPRIVVVGLGTNWTVTTNQIRAALRILGPQRVLGLVTPKETGGVASSDQAVIRAAGRRWPRRVKVLDWVSHSAGHPDWFWSDGLHLRPRGARALARLMSQAFSWEVPVVEASWRSTSGNAATRVR